MLRSSPLGNQVSPLIRRYFASTLAAALLAIISLGSVATETVVEPSTVNTIKNQDATVAPTSPSQFQAKITISDADTLVASVLVSGVEGGAAVPVSITREQAYPAISTRVSQNGQPDKTRLMPGTFTTGFSAVIDFANPQNHPQEDALGTLYFQSKGLIVPDGANTLFSSANKPHLHGSVVTLENMKNHRGGGQAAQTPYLAEEKFTLDISPGVNEGRFGKYTVRVDISLIDDGAPTLTAL